MTWNVAETHELSALAFELALEPPGLELISNLLLLEINNSEMK